ncbi:diguanylate cyclase (GGDEF)-like protein [Janthinobacterium sp. CG_23.3]|uniref:GGDEF domain-containing protein n=1 Tax=unclassified Janthinobacterium TaxID=2610881 RepID=UPI00034587D7|nr:MULTISPECIES: GGDEF domain-containing protein [unclassified Janthinobacterium]MEC5160433.1 diguanylate cyclase (GGDEF)-like protein [Janthinobacterium sp. CG_S6]
MDIKTLVLALALGNLSLCAGLFFFGYGRAASPGLSTWSAAKQCQAVAWLLLYFRGIIPDFLSIPVGSALLFAGVALDAGASWEAAGRGGWRRVVLPALVLAVAGFVLCYVLDMEQALRSAVGALIVAVFFLAGVAALALGWSGAGMLQRFLVVTLSALALVLGASGALPAALPDGWSWITPAGMQAAGLGAFYLMMLSNGFGYLLLSRERGERELARLEVLDTLTDVPNRRGFYNALAPWMALARRPGTPTAMIVLNLDHFKRVNDSYGHPVGDAVLKAIVDVCKKQLRDSDLMGRLGGAEFAIQLPRTTLADALVVAERVRAAVERMPVKTERAVITLTASLGVTTIRAEDSSVSLFQRADEALQEAKRAGRNRVVEAPAAAPLDA